MSRPADAYRREQSAARKARGEGQGKPASGKAPGRPSLDPAIKGFIKETSRDTGYRKAAQFLMLLGKDEAARVLRHMAPEEVQGITLEIARTQHIESREAAKILEEFGYIRETKDLIARGGIDKAQEVLEASVGKEKAQQILEKVRKDMAPPPFTFLQDIDVHQAIALVKSESVPVAALILAHLEPRLAARILQALSPEAQKEIVPRIAKTLKVDSEVLRKAEETLRNKVRDMGEPVAEEVDGKTALTEILRYLDPAREQAILAELDTATANQIRKKLFTIDVVFQIPDKDLQQVLRDYADRELALVVRGVEEKTARRILGNVSERRRELIRLEGDTIGAPRKADLDRAQQDFLEYIQLLEQKGEIAILRERDEYV
ncbi:MAG TPA: flagellar motor switch protein FliG [Spirochaetia bacterium]|nr:flagellar motor switch protein FliG [Spirochaetia bacterium]